VSPFWAASCPERRGEVRRGCSPLSGETQWVTPADDGPVKCEVVPHLAVDPVVLLAPLC